MIAKIVQGQGFRGVIGYVLEKEKASLLYAEGVRLKDKESIVKSFIAQQKLENFKTGGAYFVGLFGSG